MTRRMLLVAHTGRTSSLAALAEVIAGLAREGIEPVMLEWQVEELRSAPEPPSDLLRLVARSVRTASDLDDLPAPAPEVAIVLGGDGTILRALEVVRGHDIPVHGVNLGHVGFLAESEVADLTATVERLARGDYSVERRTTLDVVVREDDRIVARDWALNECAIEKADRAMMVNVAVEIDGRPVSTFGCDGVLAATPTGSTAYAFSAGGPIVWPEVDCLIVVPLSAHALFARPLVLGRSSVAAVELLEDNATSGVVWLDGRRGIDVRPGTRVEVRVSAVAAKLARLAPTPFADRLVSKFELPVEGWRGPLKTPGEG